MAKPLDEDMDEREDMEDAEDEGNSDSELVSMMGMAMLNNGGLKVIEDALRGSQEPGQVVGNFLAQLTGQIAQFGQENLGIDPSIFLQKGGFIDQLLDYIERKLGLPREFSDQVYGEVLEVMKAVAMSGQNEQPQASPAPGPGNGPGLDGGM